MVEQDGVNRVLPTAVIYFEPSWTGPSGRAGTEVRAGPPRQQPLLLAPDLTRWGNYFHRLSGWHLACFFSRQLAVSGEGAMTAGRGARPGLKASPGCPLR